MGQKHNKDLYVEDQKTIAYRILSEAKSGNVNTVRALIDDIGFSSEWFPHYHYRKVFESARDEYIDSEKNDKSRYTVSGILSRIETGYRLNGFDAQADGLMNSWRDRIDSLQSMTLGSAMRSAASLKNQHVRHAAYQVADNMKERIRTSVDPALESTIIASELQGIARHGGQQMYSYRAELIKAAELQPISSGYPWIDDHILWNRFAGKGGWTPTTLTSVLFPSENGKTSLATAFSTKWVEMGLPCVFLSAEESRTNISIRFMNAYTGIRPDEIVRYVTMLAADEDHTINDEIEDALKIAQEYFFAYEISGEKVEMERLVRRHRTQFGATFPMLVMVDHIGAIDQGNSNWSRELEAAAKMLKVNLAEALNTSVIVFSQVPADMEEEFKLKNYTTRREARGSRGIRQWSDISIAGCRHNGVPMPSTSADAFQSASVIMQIKNRYRDDRRGRINWGCYNFDVNRGIIDYLITDDWQEQFSISGDKGDVL